MRQKEKIKRIRRGQSPGGGGGAHPKLLQVCYWGK